MTQRRFLVGVDIGGTFADFCAVEEGTGRLLSYKTLTTPSEPGRDVLQGIQQLRERFGIEPDRIGYFTHGTTVGINAIIQRKGIKLCLLTTVGFSDVLELARLRMPDPYDLFSRRPPPIVPRDRVFSVEERTLADGTIERHVDEASVLRALAQAKAAGAEGIAIAFLHSYRNDTNERAVRRIIDAVAPELPVFCSSEVWPILREYERTSTTVLHGYVQPIVAQYIGSLQEMLGRAGVRVEPMITKSNGGVMPAELGKTQCVQMLLSGTAAGAIGAGFVARSAGLGKVIALDVGGTSADVAILIDGQPAFRTGEKVGDFPLQVPTVSVTSIGAGGGSVATVDEMGILRVGPESVGSTPGPACYGRGGSKPTLTDAFVVCGLLGHEALGYSAVSIDRERAAQSFAGLAQALGRTLVEAADAVIAVAVSDMYREVSKLVSREGIDPRECTLLGFGGAGPMVAGLLGRELHTRDVLIPPMPGVLAALGGLVARPKHDMIRTVHAQLDTTGAGELAEAAAELHAKATAWIEGRKDGQRYDCLVSADLRYRGQSYELTTPLELGWLVDRDLRSIAHAFHEEHVRFYGYADDLAGIEVTAVRMLVVGEERAIQLPKRRATRGHPLRKLSHTGYLDGAVQAFAHYRRDELPLGEEIRGPCVISQDDTTTVVPAAFSVRVDEFDNLLLAVSAGRS